MLAAYLTLFLLGTSLAIPLEEPAQEQQPQEQLQQQQQLEPQVQQEVAVQQPALKSSLDQELQVQEQANLDGSGIVSPGPGHPVAFADQGLEGGAPLGGPQGPAGDAPEKPEGDLDTANTFGWGYYRPYYRSYYYSPYNYRSYYRPSYYGWGRSYGGWGWGGYW